MNSEAGQFKMRLAKARVDSVFKRKGSGFYQARVWVGDKVHRRTTRAKTKSGGEAAIPIIRRELTREPRTSTPTPKVEQVPLF